MANDSESTEAPAELRQGSNLAYKLAIANLIGGLAVDAGAAGGAGVTPAFLKTQQVSLHTADPGTTGASEVPNGAYTRQDVTWTSAAEDTSSSPSRAKITANPIPFNVPAGAITHYGVWDKGTGTFLYGKALNPAVTLSAPGSVTVTPTHAYGLA